MVFRGVLLEYDNILWGKIERMCVSSLGFWFLGCFFVCGFELLVFVGFIFRIFKFFLVSGF